MNEQYPWNFEECSPEDVCDPAGLPWAHAVRGRKPARPVVMGYGNTPSAADADARTKATQYDAHEMLGERGEVVTAIEIMPLPRDIDFIDNRRYMLQQLYKMYGWSIMEPADSAIVKISV